MILLFKFSTRRTKRRSIDVLLDEFTKQIMKFLQLDVFGFNDDRNPA